MIYRILFFIAGVIAAPAFLLSQSAFSKLSFNEALQKATAQNKLLWVQLDAKDCEKCNVVADSALSNLELVGFIQNNFIAIRPRVDKDDWKMLADSFNAPKWGVLFIDDQKNVVYRIASSTSSFKKYINDGKVAQAKAAIVNHRRVEIKNLSFDTSLAGKIKKLEYEIETRIQQKLTADSLLEVLCNLMPIEYLNNIKYLQIILKGAPILGSRPDSLARANKDLFKQAWYGMDSQTRGAINNSIISNSIQKAIGVKNAGMALRVAAYSRGIYDKVEDGQKRYYKTLDFYYRGVRDTLNIVRNLSSLINYGFMNKSPEMIRLEDSIKMENPKLMANNTRYPADTIRENGKILMIKTTTSFINQSELIAREINAAAWDIYKMTSDAIYLQQAERWAAHALKFADKAEINDTYARLLYKNGKTAEAIVIEEKAINILQTQGKNSKEFEAVLNAMKAGEQIFKSLK